MRKKRVDNSKDIVGRPGGLARAKRLSAQRRKEIAQRAAQARWKGKKAEQEVQN